MASYVLYLLTGAILALMAGRHLRGLWRVLPHAHQDPQARLNLSHGVNITMLHWAEAALSALILLFGLWMAFTASLLLTSSLLHFLS
jgi:hypothetical protein